MDVWAGDEEGGIFGVLDHFFSPFTPEARMKSIRYAAAATVLVLLAGGCGSPNPVAPRAEPVAPVHNVGDGGSAMGSGNLTDADSTKRGLPIMGSGN